METRNVMIIDDDINMMDAMSVVLASHNMDLIQYTEVLPAVEELKNNRCDILIINYILGGSKVDNIINMIRTFDKDLYIILMFSNSGLTPSIDIMRSLDIQALYEKGSNLDSLILQIESGFKSVEQINSIRNMTTQIQVLGIEFATALKKAIGARDNYTREHSDRVAAYTKLLATYLKMPAKEIETLELAANFHDIGKIGISDTILLKKGKLTDEEYTSIKLHPVTGANILSTSEIFKDTIPIILHHHERYDGTGYPEKQKGDAIVYGARLLAVCDTFDAITSLRVYNEQKDIDSALQELIRVKGTQLDPDIVDSFVEVVNLKRDDIQKIHDLKVSD